MGRLEKCHTTASWASHEPENNMVLLFRAGFDKFGIESLGFGLLQTRTCFQEVAIWFCLCWFVWFFCSSYKRSSLFLSKPQGRQGTKSVNSSSFFDAQVAFSKEFKLNVRKTKSKFFPTHRRVRMSTCHVKSPEKMLFFPQ